MRRFALSLLVCTLATTACQDVKVDYIDTNTPPVELDGSVAGLDSHGGLGLFPNDLYTVDDPTSYTGRRVTFSYKDHATSTLPWIPVKQDIANQVTGLDGFGTTAGAWVRFSEAIDRSDQERLNSNSFIGYFEDGKAKLVPSEVIGTKHQIAFRPLLPLPPNTPAFFFVTTGILDAEKLPVKQDQTLTTILKNQQPEGYSEALAQRVRDAANAVVSQNLVGSTDDIAALAVFTTQAVHETDMEIAEILRSTDPKVQIDGPCTEAALYRVCSFSFEVPNFINSEGSIDDNAADNPGPAYRLKAHVRLPPVHADDNYDIPRNPEQGFASSIFGHGLTGGGIDAGQIARFTADTGLATLAIDAPQHGDHPLRTAGNGELDTILELFGLTIKGRINIHGRKLRDGWRHSNFDKLMLVRAMQSGIDFDGDGKSDLDPDRMTYLGGSLGAIQGSEFLALTDAFVAGFYAVGGGRISDIIRHGALFAAIRPILFPKQDNESLMQIYIMLQTIVEKGDGANWAPYILQDRLVGDRIPHIGMQISVPDDVVPPEAGMVIARALGVDAIGEMPLPDELVKSIGTSAKSNHPSGQTVALLQTDWIRTAPGRDYQVSEHAKSADSLEGIAYWTHAFLTLFSPEGVMELVDPYSLPTAPPRPN